MANQIIQEEQEEMTRIALRLYEEDQQNQERESCEEAVRTSLEEMGIPAVYLEQAAEILKQERLERVARKERRSRAFGMFACTALTVPVLGGLLYCVVPELAATRAWWRTPALTAQQRGTVLGKWHISSPDTPMADLKDATLEFFPNGALVLETPQKRVVSGSYAVRTQGMPNFQFPEYRGTVLMFSDQELRLLLHYNTYILGIKSGEAEGILTYDRDVPRSWGQYLALCLLVGGSGIVGLSAMVKGATTATQSPMQIFLTYFGVSAGLVTIALAARYTGFIWAGVPVSAAYLGFGYGFLGKRLQATPEQQLTEG